MGYGDYVRTRTSTQSLGDLKLHSDREGIDLSRGRRHASSVKSMAMIQLVLLNAITRDWRHNDSGEPEYGGRYLDLEHLLSRRRVECYMISISQGMQ